VSWSAFTPAYAASVRLARRQYENFPVASWLLPRSMRPHVAALYAFARIADDFADEGDRPALERLRLLDDWQARLHRCAGAASPPARPDIAGTDDGGDAERLFEALGETIRACRLPIAPFDDLLSAFRQDVTVTRYATWDDLFDYCRRSANPVGRLVLRIAGYDDRELDRLSDCVCTALQLANFWQDMDRDRRRGRVYVPADVARRCGAQVADLEAGRWTPEWARASEMAVACTRDLFRGGRSICDRVSGRLGLELRMTWLGGMRILDRLEAAGYNPLAGRPRLGLFDAPPIAWRMLTWNRDRRLRVSARSHD